MNYYFLIETEGKKVGVINAKDANSELRFSEGGIFIGDQNYIDSFASVFSTLCLLNFTFIISNFKHSIIKISRTNERAIQYNKIIGYKLIPGQEQLDFQRYELTKDDYLKFGKKLNESAIKLNPENAELKYSGEPSELNFDVINHLLINQKRM